MKKRIIALALAMVMCLGVLPLSASAAGGTYTVTFDVKTFDIPGDLVGSCPAPITVTDGGIWDLPQPIWFTATGFKIGWYTIDLEPVNDGDPISLGSDITLYACPVDYATERHNVLSQTYDQIAATASAWAQADVAEAFKAGLVPANRLAFEPGNLGLKISRLNFCELIAKLVEAKTGMSATAYAESLGKTVGWHFVDSNNDPAIEAAYALGIVNGMENNKFNPSWSISRQEAAAMLERAAKVLGISSSGAGMSFSDGVADWAKGSVAFVSGLVDPVSGSPVMGGVGNGRFDPTGKYTNEQAIVTVLRLYHCA